MDDHVYYARVAILRRSRGLAPIALVRSGVRLTAISPEHPSSSPPPQASSHLDLRERLSHTDAMTSAISNSTLGTGEQPAANPGLPIPMSFPAVLRAPKLADRFAHLRLASASDEPTPDAASLVVKKNKREDREGKRWIRRKENCTFRWLNAIAQGLR